MISIAPKVDKRTAREIAAQVRELLPEYVGSLTSDPKPSGPTEALVAIFSRYCEIIVERLNKVPEKNLVAFLNLLGASQARAQAARAPLTFYASAQSVGRVVIPARTQVAAVPDKDDNEPVVFETEQDMVVAPVLLDALWVRDEASDQYADYRDLLDQAALPPAVPKVEERAFVEGAAQRLTGRPAAGDLIAAFEIDKSPNKTQAAVDKIIEELPARGVPVFRGNQRFDHFLFIALNPVSLSPEWKELRIRIVPSHELPQQISSAGGQLVWQIWDGVSGISIEPDSDSTGNLTRSGELLFTKVPAPPLTIVNGRAGHWLRASWKAAAEESNQVGQVGTGTRLPSPDAMPSIDSMTGSIETEEKPRPPDRAFLNNAPLDLSKDFFPFGAKPAFGDTLYLESSLFAAAGASVSILITMTNPASAQENASVPAVKPVAPKLQWEFWNGLEWTTLGISEFGRSAPVPAGGRVRIGRQEPLLREDSAAGGFSDTTQAFVETGQVNFRLPGSCGQCAVYGQLGYWIRVRLVSGDYGHEVRYEFEQGKGYVVTPATFAPPVIHLIRIQQALRVESLPAAIITYNDFTYRDVTGQSFTPFLIGTQPPCCYLGLQPIRGTFPADPVSLYLGVTNPTHIEVDDSSATRLTVIWEYWNGKTWSGLTLQDETTGLRHSGLIKFVAPYDFSSGLQFGTERFWLRARKAEGTTADPALRRILLNTTMAAQTQTTLGEILGSGTGRPNQAFRTARKPVLDGQILEVLEPAQLSSEERERVLREEGPKAISETPLSTPGAVGVWVRWREVIDFENSGPRDRHYLLNRETGGIAFGNGVNGMVPPNLTSNVRMALYRTGGGAAGNKPAGSIMQLKTTVPYVERVVNFLAADGGSDVETVSSVINRAPLEIRHGGRPVTAEDFEDLTQRASLEVARAKCLPVCDLELDPEGKKRSPGAISVVVVPRWAKGQVKPEPPGTELFARVREFLDQRRLQSVKLVLAAPDYVRIDMKVDITAADPATFSQAELAVTLALNGFLHPLTGFNGEGWPFGRLPARSDLYALIESVPGVEHVQVLEMTAVPASPEVLHLGRFLVYAGSIQVAATLEN